MSNKIGRPKKYTKVEEMQRDIDKYFDSCYRPITRIVKGKCINVKNSYGEERLFDKEGANGAKFSLANNFSSWKDKKDVDANVNTEIKVTLIDD